MVIYKADFRHLLCYVDENWILISIKIHILKTYLLKFLFLNLYLKLFYYQQQPKGEIIFLDFYFIRNSLTNELLTDRRQNAKLFSLKNITMGQKVKFCALARL